MSAEADTVLADARAYSDRIAARMTDDQGERDEFSKAAFLSYLQGFKAGLAHAVATVTQTGVIGGGK